MVLYARKESLPTDSPRIRRIVGAQAVGRVRERIAGQVLQATPPGTAAEGRVVVAAVTRPQSRVCAGECDADDAESR